MQVEILAQGPRFLAIDKPAGWLSVPSRWGERDPRPVAGLHAQELAGCRLWPVHRLDEEAGGVLLFAKDAETHAAAGSWFQRGLVVKTYEAMTEATEPGRDAEAPATWRSLLLRGKKRAYESPHGKASETRVASVEEATWNGIRVRRWVVHPVTGRPHQLRVELSRRGHPIVGDALYGARVPLAPGAIALRCVRLELPAPAEALALPLRIEARSLAEWLDLRGFGA